MREVNFSIPNVNKASVGITTALYDRRALDCTSTLPLINSLNHLGYLTTSSARIRDILTVDGGVERLVCILKAGRSKDMMDMWKWNLAFQCVVNIGVRGSENVRTRVVEADMVPVIATILDNYVKIVDRCKEKADAESKRQRSSTASRSRDHKSSSFTNRSERGISNPENRSSRRQAPPPSIAIPPFTQPPQASEAVAAEGTPTALPLFALTSPIERTTFPRHHHHRHDGRHRHSLHATGPIRHHAVQPLATAVPTVETPDTFGLRPVRDIDRLPSMVSGFQSGVTSQPESPTTPMPPGQAGPVASRPSSTAGRSRQRPSIRHQRSMSGGSDDDGQGDGMASDESAGPENATEPLVDIRPGIEIQGMEDNDSMLEAVETPLGLTAPNASEPQDSDTFNITPRSAVEDGSIMTTTTATATATMTFSPPPATITTPAQPVQPTSYSRYLQDRPASAAVMAAMPRDEDVLMSLQLLAYVSKYCNLRSYFQESHLVPKLKIGNEILLLDDDMAGVPTPTTDELDEEEFLVPDDFNIFPLVEKFTVRHHSPDMQYWAGVVMRNLCRKDDSRGGVRQCAYYQCGKWEKATREFAKCRRCRRTKYCSKECQKSAWVYHRHWCVAAQQS